MFGYVKQFFFGRSILPCDAAYFRREKGEIQNLK